MLSTFSAMLMLVSISGGTEARPPQVSGTLTNEVVLSYEEWYSGPNLFIVMEKQWTWEGDITGTQHSHLEITAHGNNLWIVHEWATLEAEWGDLSGTMELRIVGQGSPPNFVVHFCVVSGTGDFANVNGRGTVVLGPTHSPYYVAWLNP
ncbi:MAG: hypothetical protein JSV94_05310 [Methanobacteriota archaeon]|nr:MAG: hypothetical protein JSV94_05310 [Euryarchaeota archaeon]